MTSHIRLGISSCLLGEAVRYDGGHKRDSYIAHTLARYFEFVPVCPEVAIGLGVPRPAIHLVGRPAAIRAVGRDDPSIDVTRKLAAFGSRMGRTLDDLSGYLFKSRSPSCGLERVPVNDSRQVRFGRGIYSDAFLTEHPHLPAEEEEGLGDPDRRDNFLERVFAYRRWQDLAGRMTATRLADFHAAHKLILMAHSPREQTQLGRIVARAGRGRVHSIAGEYLAAFMHVLARPATPARHENALLHLLGYLKRKIDRHDKAELLGTIRRFRTGTLPRAAVLELLRDHFRRHPDPYVARQFYLYPDKREQLLRGL